jgi:hypothetical protein
VTPDLRAAALYVCSKAHTVDDAAMLLDALGLVADGALTWPTVPAGLEPRNPRNIAVVPGGVGWK